MTALLEETRGGIIDNVHHGHIAVVDVGGRLLFAYGEPEITVYGRSALKPMQVLPVLESGAADHYGLDERDLTLCMASHSGLPEQRARVLALLQRIGCNETDLVCAATPPTNVGAYETLIKEAGSVNKLCNCCSGVHAGMLATAAYLGDPVEGYHRLSHPVQQRVLEAVSDALRYPVDQLTIGLDGCGIPTFATPLRHLAWGFARLTEPDAWSSRRAQAVRRVTTAMVNHPELLTEEDSFNTHLIRSFAGRLIAKEGAKGVLCLGDMTRHVGIAIKVEDGNKELLPSVVMEILRQLDWTPSRPTAKLESYMRQPIQNGQGDSVGAMRPTFTLTRV